MKKVILSIFVVISIASGIYVAYAILNDNIEPIVGSVLVVACFLVLLQCVLIFKKHLFTDKAILLLFLPVLVITSTTLAYAKVEPFAEGKEQLISKLQALAKPRTTPSGTFTAYAMGYKASVTFKRDILETYNELDGKRIFKYEISEDGQTITLTDVVSEKTTTEAFKYLKDYGIVVFRNTQYHKD